MVFGLAAVCHFRFSCTGIRIKRYIVLTRPFVIHDTRRVSCLSAAYM